MMETADSIKQYGVLVPAIARPDPEGGYELVAGHLSLIHILPMPLREVTIPRNKKIQIKVKIFGAG